MSLTTKSSNQHLILQQESTWLASLHRVNNRHKEQWLRNPYILLNVVKATIIRHKGSNLLPVLHQLNTSTLTDGRVRLLGLNTATQWKYLTLAQATQSWDIKSTHDKHTSSPERCPWHEMIQQRVSSIHYPSGSSCMPCQPTSGSCGGSWACAQLPYHVSSCDVNSQLLHQI